MSEYGRSSLIMKTNLIRLRREKMKQHQVSQRTVVEVALELVPLVRELIGQYLARESVNQTRNLKSVL